jgi:hypothetical protein
LKKSEVCLAVLLRPKTCYKRRDGRLPVKSVITSDVQQICTWLGLAPGSWPPDHYTLLGLPAGEADIERIEHQVHERLMRLRCYQLSHPGLATEAMTHLAKAFDCLTTPERKKTYDAEHFPHLPPAAPALPSARVPTTLASDTAETTPLPYAPTPPCGRRAEPSLKWQPSAAPPPVRTPADGPPAPLPPVIVFSPAEPPPVRLPPSGLACPDAIGIAQPPSPALPSSGPPPTDSGKLPPTYLTPAAVQLLGTRRDLFESVLWTRRLMRAWNRAGKYLGKPQRRLAKPAEAAELTRLLVAIDELVQESPKLLGQPGQPGYRVLALARAEPVAEHFKSLDEAQREALATDYAAGRKLLDEFREMLMDQIKGHRRLTSWQRGCRVCDAVLTAHVVWVLLGLGLVAALILVGVWIL